MQKGKEIKLAIIGVIFLLLIVVGASYSYFSIINEDKSVETTINGVTESIDKFGTSILSQETKDLHINLGLSDLAPGKIGTNYYATTDEKEKYNKEQSKHNLSLVEIIKSENTNAKYNCTSEITIKTEGILAEEISAGDGRIYLGHAGEDEENSAKISPSEIDLKDVVMAEEGYKVAVEYTIIGNSKIYVTGDFKIENRASDQNLLAGKAINIEISNRNLTCSVEKLNAVPSNFEFYIQSQEKGQKYTNNEEVDVYLNWQAEDIDSYCIKEGYEEDCEWKKAEGKSVNEKYTFKDSTNGEKKLKAYLKNATEDLLPEKEDTIILDKEMPTIEILRIKERYTNQNEINIELVGKDNYELSEYCLTEEENTKDCTWKEITEEIKANISGEDGTKKLYGYVKDKAGNVSEVKESTEVVLDTNIPVIETFILEDEYTTSENVNGTIIYSDNLSGVEVYCISSENSTANCKWVNVSDGSTSKIEGTVNSEGKLYAFVKDRAGNISDVKESNTVILDKEIPEITELILKGDSLVENDKYTKSRNIQVTIKGHDEGSGISKYCLMDRETTEECVWKDLTDAEIEYELSESDGEKAVYAYIKDKVGNISKVASKTITLDTGLPSVTGLTLKGSAADTNQESTYTNTKDIKVTITSSDEKGSGVYEYCLVLGNTPGSCVWQSIQTGEIDYSLSETDGVKNVYAYVRDKVGNVSAYSAGTTMKSITLDTKKPTLNTVELKGTALTTDFAASYTKNANVTVTLDYADETSGVYQYCYLVTTDNVAPTAESGCTEKWSSIVTNYSAVLAKPDGTKYFHVYVKDKAGNISLVLSNNIMLDTGVPVINSTTLIGTAADATQQNLFTSKEGIKATLTYSDAGSGVYQYCLMTSNTTTNCSWQDATTEAVDYTLVTGDGAKNVFAFVRDKVGNVSAYVSGKSNASITLDTGVPTVDSIALSGTAATGFEATFTRATAIDATLTYSDDISGVYQYCLMTSNTTSGCTWASATTKSVKYNLATGDGKKNVFAFVRDKAGNISKYVSGTTNSSITLDQTVPSNVQLTLTKNTFTYDSETRLSNGLTAKLTATEANVYQYCFNNKCGTANSNKTIVNFSTFKFGEEITVSAYVEDKAGNKSTAVSKKETPGGTGSSADPYRIWYLEDLVRLSQLVNSGTNYSGKYFKLERNLSFTSTGSFEDSNRTDFGDLNKNSNSTEGILAELTTGIGFTPIGVGKTFDGIFDGGNYYIYNFFMRPTGDIDVGFFGRVNNATIKNLNITGSIESGEANDIGGVVGNANGNVVIDNVTNGISVKGTANTHASHFGGIVGYIQPTGNVKITNSTNKSTIQVVNTAATAENIGANSFSLGGIVGHVSGDLTISGTSNSGTIYGGNRCGGIVGYIIVDAANKGKKIQSLEGVSNTGRIQAVLYAGDNAMNAGGLVGYTQYGNLRIINSYNSGNVSSLKSNASGLVGSINYETPAIIFNSYNTGTVSNSSGHSSGLVRLASGTLNMQNVYNSGDVSSTSGNMFIVAYFNSGMTYTLKGLYTTYVKSIPNRTVKVTNLTEEVTNTLSGTQLVTELNKNITNNLLNYSNTPYNKSLLKSWVLSNNVVTFK